MRLIDADKLSSEMEFVFENARGMTALAARLVWAFIEKTDTVDDVAQKKGHWVENHASDHAWKCSECGCGYTDSKLSFCYDCGADMREQKT